MVILLFVQASCNNLYSDSYKKTYKQFAEEYDLPTNNMNYVLYNNVLSNVETFTKLYDSTHTTKSDDEVVAKAQYTGYQLYDVDKDGVLDLFIFRVSAFGHPYIDYAYTISDGKVSKLNIDNYDIESSYGTGATSDFAYVALNDGRLAEIGGKSRCISNLTIIDMRTKRKSITSYLSESLAPCIYERKVNGVVEDRKEIDSMMLSREIEHIRLLIGYFPTRIITELIPEK